MKICICGKRLDDEAKQRRYCSEKCGKKHRRLKAKGVTTMWIEVDVS